MGCDSHSHPEWLRVRMLKPTGSRHHTEEGKESRKLSAQIYRDVFVAHMAKTIVRFQSIISLISGAAVAVVWPGPLGKVGIVFFSVNLAWIMALSKRNFHHIALGRVIMTHGCYDWNSCIGPSSIDARYWMGKGELCLEHASWHYSFPNGDSCCNSKMDSLVPRCDQNEKVECGKGCRRSCIMQSWRGHSVSPGTGFFLSCFLHIGCIYDPTAYWIDTPVESVSRSLPCKCHRQTCT